MSDFQITFAENLRQLRKARGLTQKALAQQLGYSEKTISKWECGDTFPPLDTFAEICDTLKINSQTLLYRKNTHYFLGIDGSNSKTTFTLADLDGNTTASVTLGVSSPIDIGIEASCRVLQEGIRQVCGRIPLYCVWMYAGIAGCSSGNNYPLFLDFFGKLGFAGFNCGSNYENILSAGLQEEDGIAAITGTGFCVFQSYQGTRRRVCGWGHFFDEGGSGFNLGREALSAYFSAKDGSGPSTELTEMILQKDGGNPDTLLTRLYDEGKRKIASFAPLVMEAAVKGDAVASEILQRNVRIAAEKIAFAAKPICQDGHPVKIVITGGLSANSLFISMLTESLLQICPVELTVLQVAPIAGAVRLAKKLYEESIL